MSYGWNSESALLPSKPKEIKGVTSASMLALKASAESKSGGVVWHRSKRGKTTEPMNRGVAKRAKKDLEDDGAATLAAKAMVYDELRRNRTNGSDDVLVNFQKDHQPQESQEEPQEWAWSTGRSDVQEADVAALLEDAKRKARVDSREESQIKSQSHVKSQWDRGLTATEKTMLTAVADETEEGRKNAQAKLSQREHRRQQLHAMLDKRRSS